MPIKWNKYNKSKYSKKKITYQARIWYNGQRNWISIKENTPIEYLKIKIPKANKQTRDQFAEEFEESSDKENNNFIGFQKSNLPMKS